MLINEYKIAEICSVIGYLIHELSIMVLWEPNGQKSTFKVLTCLNLHAYHRKVLCKSLRICTGINSVTSISDEDDSYFFGPWVLLKDLEYPPKDNHEVC